MAKRLLPFFFACFIVGVLLLPPAVAVGASVLSTVTATFIPPSPSPTPINKTCPVGTPSGWGTYTPSPLWAIECGQCEAVAGTATPTISPTPWLGTGTPPAGCTPMPAGTGTPSPFCVVPTGTVAPTATPNGCGALSVASFEVPQTLYTSTLVSSDFTCENMDNGVWCHGQYVYTDTSAGGDSYRMAQLILNTNGSQGYFEYNNNFTHSNGETYGTGSGSTMAGSTTFDTPVSWSALSGQLILPKSNSGIISSTGMNYLKYGGIGCWGTAGSTCTWDIDFKIYPSRSCAVAPTPTPSPTPFVNAGYCASVAPPLDDFSFDLFKNDGAVNCDMGWDGFTVGETTFPAVQICFQPVQFGVIKMFAQEYELGVIALAVATAFIWRFMRTV